MRGLLQDNIHLIIRCHICDRQVRLRAVVAVDVFGLDCSMQQAMRRLRCITCGRPGRDGKFSLWPCSLDQSAASARWQAANGMVRGGGTPEEELAQTLATLRRLLGGAGELGGDGPVQWPVDGPSNAG